MPKAESRPAGGFGGWLGDGILCCAVLLLCCAIAVLCNFRGWVVPRQG